MGYIYKIENTVNKKIYIGQTIHTVEIRKKEHIEAAKYGSSSVIYRAMRKYGIENFIFTEIEYCDDSLLDEREIYWIAHYDSYNNGYNSTTGGKGVQKYNKDEIYELWESGMTAKEIGLTLNTDYRPIVRCLLGLGIAPKDIKQRRDMRRKKHRDNIMKCWNDGLSEGEIAKLLELDMSTVKRALNENGVSGSDISKRGYLKNSGADDDKIINYWNDGKTQSEIKQILHVGSSKIRNVLLSYGIQESEIKSRMKLVQQNKTGTPVNQLDLQGNLIKTYPSISEAKKDGFHNIHKVLSGEYTQCGGYKWEALV